MSEPSSAYGLWSLVVLNSLVFIIFAFSFAKPRTQRDWRSFGAFSAFIVALFTEMYGYPLTMCKSRWSRCASKWMRCSTILRWGNNDLNTHT